MLQYSIGRPVSATRAQKTSSALSLLVHVVGEALSASRTCAPAARAASAGPRSQTSAQMFPKRASALEHASRAAGLEIALLVEDLVVGQQALVIARQHRAVTQHRGRIVALAAVLHRVAGTTVTPAQQQRCVRPHARRRDNPVAAASPRADTRTAQARA